MTLFVHAPNVHQGGGRTLLGTLLDQLDHSACCVLDERMPVNNQALHSSIRFIKPRLVNRFGAEVFLSRTANMHDTVLCFGNLPPLFKSPAKVFVFLQNRYMFGTHDFSSFPLASRARLMLERLWFRWRMQSNYQIIVQSPTMQRELKNTLGFNASVLPFLPANDEPNTVAEEIAECKKFDFVYVSSAEPHKNHAALLDAWVLLAEQGIRPSLALTVSQHTAFNVANLLSRKRPHMV